MIIQFLRRIFHLQKGDGSKAVAFSLLAFIWAVAVNLGNKFSDTLFLLHVGSEFLPQAYIVTAISSLTLSLFLLYAYHHFSIHCIFSSLLLIGSIFYISTALCFEMGIVVEKEWFWFALKSLSYLIFISSLTSLWSFIDEYHHIQSAKRLFALTSSFIYLGFIVTGNLIQFKSLESSSIYALSSMLLFMTLGIIQLISRKIEKPCQPEVEESDGSQFDFVDFMKSVLSSRFTVLLLSADFIIQILNWITEFNYMFTFENYFTDQKEAIIGYETSAPLTQFIGNLICITGLGNITFGLFIYSRLVKRFGVNNLDVVAPLSFISLFLLWQFETGFIAPVLGFFVGEGLLWAMDDNNFNIQLNATPQKIKYKIRVLVESVFEPIGILVGGVILSFASEYSKIIGLIFSVFSLFIAFNLRREYPKALIKNLSEESLHFDYSISDWISSMLKGEKKQFKKQLLEILNGSSKKFTDLDAKLLAIQGLVVYEDCPFDQIIEVTDLFETEKKMKFIEIIDGSQFSSDKRFLDLLKRWRELKGSVVLLTKVRSSLAHNSNSLQQVNTREEIKTLLQSGSESDIIKGLCHLKVLKERSLFPIVVQLLDRFSSRMDIRAYVIQALKEIQVESPSEIQQLLSIRIHYTAEERRKIEMICSSVGQKAIPILLQICKNRSLHEDVRLIASRLLGRLDLSFLNRSLSGIIVEESKEVELYRQYARQLPESYLNQDLSILKEALHFRSKSIVNFVIQLIGIARSVNEGELLVRTLWDPNERMRAYAQETVERVCERKIFQMIHPLLPEAKVKNIEEEKLHLSTLQILLDIVDRIKDSRNEGDYLIEMICRNVLKKGNV